MVRLFNLATGYLLSWWLPSVLVLAALGGVVLNELVLALPRLTALFIFFVLLNFAGTIAAAIVQAATGRKRRAAVSVLAFLATGWIAAQLMIFVIFRGLFDDQPDPFGKNIVIPPGMEVHDPEDHFEEPEGDLPDPFTTQLVAEFARPPKGDSEPETEPALPEGLASAFRVSTDLAELAEFGGTNRQALIDYFAASTRWFVTEEDGKSYAYRRLKMSGRWQNSLAGYYSSFDLGTPMEEGMNFQVRVVIGFDGPVFLEPFSRKGTLTETNTGPGDIPLQGIEDRTGGQGLESYFVLRSSAAALEVFEQSGRSERPATALAVAEVKRELQTALGHGEGIRIAPAAISSGPPELQLARGMQGGIYHVRGWVNPGAAGTVYLKVFEATSNTRLSSERIRARSQARIGFSVRPEERFRYQSEITIYEGDWGNFYPARFELWFVPDQAGPPQKLVERIFRVEGWQR
jgi:hypothetical protein